ncbi:uncharacterized protein BDR25DRAFT_244861, partial [Lindgomyces ingoldianus]
EIIGTARVISNKDLFQAQAERATKDAKKEAKRIAREIKKAVRATTAAEATIGKKRRGQKRKSAVQKAGR